MSKLLITAIANICLNLAYTPIQKYECKVHFGNCISDYSSDDKALDECLKKWNKVKDEIK